MARREDRDKAIGLRLQGKSYSEIKSELRLSKSTLSNWLKKYPLTETQIERLKEKIPARIERYRATRLKNRQARDLKVYKEQKIELLPLSDRELFIAGLFLYWGEGTKVGTGSVVISNSNPRIIQFAIFWLNHSLKVPTNKLSIRLHLYSDMDIDNETKFWSQQLSLTPKNFLAPYIKESTRSGLSYKSFGHGTCNLLVFSTELKRKIMKSIEAISDEYSKIDIILQRDPSFTGQDATLIKSM